MKEPQFVKTFEPIDCPHCSKQIIIGAQAMMSTITSINTPEQIEEVKKSILERLKEIKFKSLEDKKRVEDWLMSEETLVDKGDIESLIKQISLEQINDSNEEKEK